MDRLSADSDRFDDARGQEGEGQNEADIAFVDFLARRKLCDGGASADLFEAAVSPNHLFQQNWIDLARSRSVILDDEARLDAAAPDLHWHVTGQPNDNADGRERQRHRDAAAAQLDSLDELRQCRTVLTLPE